MEQKSDVEYRAEKIYKNSREKFGYLIREVVSNAIHAAIIRDGNIAGAEFQPMVEVDIRHNESSSEILVRDNGDGFTDFNSKYFTHLDTRNPEKEKLNLHPMGQGRLALVHFSDVAVYESNYRLDNGKSLYKSFNYPDISLPLFDIESPAGVKSDFEDSRTSLKLQINKQQTYKRADTFFKKYSDVYKLKNWFIENFFPFFMEYVKLKVSITFNGSNVLVTRDHIVNNIKNIQFTVLFNEDYSGQKLFTVWLVDKEDAPKTKNQVVCFARHLRAEIDGGKIIYDIDLPFSLDFYLTSPYFDERVDQKGDKIEMPSEHIENVQSSLTAALDKHFINYIESNSEESKKNVRETENKYPSLSVFIEKVNDSTRTVYRESDLVSGAVERKGKAEKNYWLNQDSESEESEKLLNSSLHIYIDHRRRVLQKLKELINRFDQSGDVKNELEDDIHDLFLRRGENLKTSFNKNHLHNLWILDDKYTIFSETFEAISTRRGQEASDIYLWADDPDRPRELLILELKSPSNAHNAGNRYESMVAQVKRYASKFYKDPQRALNWNVDPSGVLYFGIILARKSDVYKEVGSNNVGGKPNKIPFLDASYFFNDEFCIDDSSAAAPRFKDIRIEMYSYEDIFQLANVRNQVFLKLLNGEFSFKENE